MILLSLLTEYLGCDDGKCFVDTAEILALIYHMLLYANCESTNSATSKSADV